MGTRSKLVLATVMVGLLAWPAWTYAADPPGQPDRVRLLVRMDPGADRGPVRAFTSQQGGIVKHEFNVVLPNVINVRNLPAGAVAALEKVPGVARVEEDRYHENLINLDESTPLIRGLQSQVTGAGFTADGTGVRVCVCDTGIDSDHLMYADRIDASAGYDFYNDDSDPEDDNGHGSHVSGIAVGGTGLSVNFGCEGDEPFQGIAPEATLIGAKILNQFGGGYDSDIIAGINYCADQSPSGGQADVINLSIGTGTYSGPCTHSWAVAANNAVASGVVVVAASGNDGFSNAMNSPACGADVIAVGATWNDTYPNCEDSTSSFPFSGCTDINPTVEDIVCFSNQSDYLDVSAPGAMIWSASNEAGGSTITTMAGTSMSSPMVAGLAALCLDMDPSLTPAQVRQFIRDGAVDLGATGFDRGYGYGRIDVIDTLALIEPEVCPNGNCGPGEDQCNCPQDCGTPPSTETSCTDDVDNDCDTDTDCDDSDCTGDPACICDDDGTCEAGEDCNNCPNDCISGTGGSVCGNGLCEGGDGEDCRSCSADCNGRTTGAPSGRFCCGATEGCGDSRCTETGWDCTMVPQGAPYCCGDGTCEGAEDINNCAIDCGCSVPADCNDSNECTTDDCVGGVCENTPVADDTPCSGGICCGGTCDAAVCSSAADCNDSEACTTDTCYSADTCSAYCDNVWPACGPSDGCCGPTCDSSDPDCESCVPAGGYCTSNADCCSNSCHPAKDYCR